MSAGGRRRSGPYTGKQPEPTAGLAQSLSGRSAPNMRRWSGTRQNRGLSCRPPRVRGHKPRSARSFGEIVECLLALLKPTSEGNRSGFLGPIDTPQTGQELGSFFCGKEIGEPSLRGPSSQIVLGRSYDATPRNEDTRLRAVNVLSHAVVAVSRCRMRTRSYCSCAEKRTTGDRDDRGQQSCPGAEHGCQDAQVAPSSSRRSCS